MAESVTVVERGVTAATDVIRSWFEAWKPRGIFFGRGGGRETHRDSVKVVAGYGSGQNRKKGHMLEYDVDGAMKAAAENWHQ